MISSDVEMWPKVEVRAMTNAHAHWSLRKYWGDWYVVAVVKEITAAKHLSDWYNTLDKGGLEARVMIWQPPVVLNEEPVKPKRKR